VAIILRPATQSDSAYLIDLEEVCMREYAEALWGVWPASATTANFDTTDHEVIEQGGVPVGCVNAVYHADHLFIDKLYIAPAFQRRGIGAYVLNIKTDEAARRGLPTKLSVLTTNPADQFYKREGFMLESETSERRLLSKPAPM
jgi:GNAT superfamily N-acetyltransferase